MEVVLSNTTQNCMGEKVPESIKSMVDTPLGRLGAIREATSTLLHRKVCSLTKTSWIPATPLPS
jgi:hypothetical protein